MPKVLSFEEGQYHVIPGYPLYEIDQFANVRRIYKTKRVLMQPSLKRGIYVIRLQSGNQRKEIPLHPNHARKPLDSSMGRKRESLILTENSPIL